MRCARWIGLVAVVFVVGSWLHAENVHFEQYGMCFEYTNVDDFTDRTNHGLACVGDLDNIATGDVLRFECYEGESSLFIVQMYNRHTRTMPEPDERLSIRYRFDKGEVYSGEWVYFNESVLGLEPAPLLEALLNDASLFVFEIDGELGRIDLSESDARAAAEKYVERCQEALNGG